MGGRDGCGAGAGVVEYALLVGLIAVVLMGAVAALGATLLDDDVEVLGRVLERGDCKLPEPADGRARANLCE